MGSGMPTTDISISKIMKRINQIYAQYFNKKYNYTGHLFQDRYHSEVIIGFRPDPIEETGNSFFLLYLL